MRFNNLGDAGFLGVAHCDILIPAVWRLRLRQSQQGFTHFLIESMAKICSIALLLFGLGCTTTAKTIEYFLEASYFRVNPDCTGPVWVQGINGMLPGPEIRVKRYDRLQVTLVNRLPTEDLAIHWHGFRQQTSQEYDGTLKVTMCGVEPGSSFTYDFIIDEPPGSYHYEHVAPSHVAARGLFGPLVVEDDETNRSYDRDVTISLFDWWPESIQHLDMKRQAYLSRPDTQSSQGNNVGLREFHNILINGKGIYNAFGPSFGNNCTDVEDMFQVVGAFGEVLRLRLMNLGAVYALRFRIDGHRFQVIQADGFDVTPYVTDAVTMGPGERFDLLVSLDQVPDSYWIRVETMENNGVHHGQLAILRYEGTDQHVEPSSFPRIRGLDDLVTLNCIDQGPISDRCRPVTDLRRPNQTFNESDIGANDTFHQIEVNVRSFRGNSPGEFTRVVDGGVNGFDEMIQGYVQFQRPNMPYYLEGQSGEHPNTLSVKLSLGETVRIVLQWQDRAAHSWHLHGHKFAVLGVFAPNYDVDCDVLYCRNRDRFPQQLLDSRVAPVKDTVYVPAGGWAAIQFKANNPGWWLLGSGMHLNEGFGVILIEGEDQMPERLKNDTYLADIGFPSCDDELEHVQQNGKGFTCQCWQDPEMKIDNMPLSTYTCSSKYLCDSLTELDGPPSRRQSGIRDRESGRTARVGLAIVELILAILLPVFKEFMHRRAKEGAGAWKEATSEIRLGYVREQLGQFSLDLDAIDRNRASSGKMTRSYSEAMANLGEENAALVQYSVPMSFEATVVNRGSTLHVDGELPGGSVCFVIGRHGGLKR